ncbi:MAG: M4 family metallopeptidase, partial [Myxococcota bacterium]
MGALALAFALTACAVEIPDGTIGDESAHGFIAGDRDSLARAERLADIYLRDPELKLLSGVAEVALKSVRIDRLGRAHLRLQQSLSGVRVFGGEVVLHLERDGSLLLVSDDLVRGLTVVTTPLITVRDAIRVATDSQGGRGRVTGTPQAELYLLRRGGRDYLTYRVQLHRFGSGDAPSVRIAFIDAHSAQPVWSYDDLRTIAPRHTHDAANTPLLPGALSRSEGDARTGDLEVDAAHDHAGVVRDCYRELFERDGHDRAGAPIQSVVHFAEHYNNAFWLSGYAVYGDGDGEVFAPLSRALDVVAHELTHAVIESDSGLLYFGESGALNESLADIFAAVCESWAGGDGFPLTERVWQLAEQVYTPGTPGDALRYMNDPGADGLSRDYYPERYRGDADNGGVHWNSGIGNLAFHLLVSGGVHPRHGGVYVPALGMDRA